MYKAVKYSLAMITAFFVAQNIFADHRSYVWTYEYMIMERGKAELEQYTTLSSNNEHSFVNATSTELNFELEVGMSEHFDFAIYQNFKQGTEGGLKYDGFKLRSRFLIGEKDQFWMDPLIYVEYVGKADFHEHKFETKFILAKDFGDYNIALNPYFEVEMEEGDDGWETEFEPKYALGFSRQFGELLSVGVEAKGGEKGHYFGPTISHGSPNLWFAVGGLFGFADIHETKPEMMIRMIIGVGL